jgi:hypothetical protein
VWSGLIDDFVVLIFIRPDLYELHRCPPIAGACGPTKEDNIMNASNIGLDLADDQILNDEFSDEALERAGGLENRAGLTIAMCSGLSSCPSAPA